MMGNVSLLAATANGDTRWLEPTYEAESQAVHHPIVGESVETLETLSDQGFLHREFVERVIACPDCGADHLDLELQCPDCQSGNTVVVDIYEHTACGCVRPREAFTEDGTDRCPECEADIESVAEECEQMGTMHHCLACDDRFDSLTECLDCPVCGTYPLADVETYRLHRYRFNEERREWLDRLVALRDELATALESHGYEVELGTPSKPTPETDLRATDSTFGVDLTVEIRDSIDVETITTLQSVVEDTDTRPVIATTGESGSATMLAEEHGITVVEFNTEDEHPIGEALPDSHRRATDGLFANIHNANDSKASLPQ